MPKPTLSTLAYKHDQPRLTGCARHHIHAHTMDTEQRKDTSDELYVLGFIAGLCLLESRD
jgi:hypothetical protein